MNVWARHVIPSFVNTYLLNIASDYKEGFSIKYGMCFQNVASLISSEAKTYILQECVG